MRLKQDVSWKSDYRENAMLILTGGNRTVSGKVHNLTTEIKLRCLNKVGGYHPHNKDPRREAAVHSAITATDLGLLLPSPSPSPLFLSSFLQ